MLHKNDPEYYHQEPCFKEYKVEYNRLNNKWTNGDVSIKHNINRCTQEQSTVNNLFSCKSYKLRQPSLTVTEPLELLLNAHWWVKTSLRNNTLWHFTSSRIPQSFSITEASPSYCLMPYPWHSLGKSYPFLEMQSGFSTSDCTPTRRETQRAVCKFLSVNILYHRFREN